MATTRTATTHWEGTLFEGAGKVTLESSGIGTYDVSWAARAEEPNGKTSPEELIAAAHASCFSMAFSSGLAKNGTPAQSLDVKVEVTFDQGESGWRVASSTINVTGVVPALLGVRVVIAQSYERIHRSNLLMMGVLPLQFMPGESRESLGLTGRETFSISRLDDGEAREVTVRADDTEFRAILRLDTPREREYLRHGGILPYVLRTLLAS